MNNMIEETVLEIIEDFYTNRSTIPSLVEKYGVDSNFIYNLLQRKTYKRTWKLSKYDFFDDDALKAFYDFKLNTNTKEAR